MLFSSAKEGQQCPQFAQVGMDKTASNKVQTNAVTVLLSLFCQHSHLMPTSKFFCPKNLFQLSLLDGFVLAYGPVPVQQEPGNEAANLSYRRNPTMYPLIYSTCSLKQGKNALLHACNYVMPFHTLLPQTSWVPELGTVFQYQHSQYKHS